MKKFTGKLMVTAGFAGWVAVGMGTVAVLGLGVVGFLAVAAASAVVANVYVLPVLERE